MKKIYFAMLAIVAALFVSCMQQEQPFDDVKFGENDVVFTFGSVDTKSADIHPVVLKGSSIPISDDGMGNGISLEETIEELNPTPATKGSPAYTVNVGKLYTSMGVYANQGSFDGMKPFSVMDMYDHIREGDPNDPNAPTAAAPDTLVGDGWRYTYSYSGNPWPDETTPVDFYFNMPVSPTGLEFTKRADKKIEFSYTSLTSGKAQEDILFSQASYSKSEHDSYLPNGAPVLMYHALSGVKFRNGHSNDGSTKTIITKVVFKGIASTGDCTVDLSADEKVSWEGLDDFATFTMDFSSLNPTYVPADGKDNPDGTVSYGSGEGKVPTFNGTSWTAAAADHNINDEDGSFTFWFIPQTVDENATMEISFLVKTPDTPDGGGEYTHIIKFGELANADWKAGQLRTYTVKPFDVDVEIFDQMTNLTKDSLHVTNTGNVDEYVRIMVIGNWYGWKPNQSRSEEPSIMVGYQYVSAAAAAAAGKADDPMVEPWYRENPVYAAGFDSTFPGGRPLASSNWKRGTGSYFYYKNVIGAGQQLSGTDALFQHYELNEDMIPDIYIPVSNSTTRQLAVGVHLVMEIVVQAVPSTKPDGTAFADCWEAWSYAVGKEIKAK